MTETYPARSAGCAIIAYMTTLSVASARASPIDEVASSSTSVWGSAMISRASATCWAWAGVSAC